MSEIRRDFGHTGIYFLKNGTNQIHGKVIYNYTYTTMALAKYGVPTGKRRLLVKIIHIVDIAPSVISEGATIWPLGIGVKAL